MTLEMMTRPSLDEEVLSLVERHNVPSILCALSELLAAEAKTAQRHADYEREEGDATKAAEQDEFAGEWLEHATMLGGTADMIADLLSRDALAEIGQ